jgi:hypothetical protein
MLRGGSKEGDGVQQVVEEEKRFNQYGIYLNMYQSFSCVVVPI